MLEVILPPTMGAAMGFMSTKARTKLTLILMPSYRTVGLSTDVAQCL